jgi:hypothetical protein
MTDRERIVLTGFLKAADRKAKRWPLVYVARWCNGKRASSGATYGARTMCLNLK